MAKDGESVRVAASLRRHGIDPSQGIRGLRRLPYIDSIAMHLTGVGDVLLVHPVAVTLGDDLTFSGGFVDDGEFFVAWVPDTDLHLSDITEVTLMLGAKKFESVTLFFNGREVFHARDEEGARDGMTIRFPLALML